MISSKLLDQPRRGLIIDAEDPPLFAEVVTYLRHGVPIHYYWKPGYTYWLDPASMYSVSLFLEPSNGTIVHTNQPK
jgi:hypothetical protein